jgi:internalin A
MKRFYIQQLLMAQRFGARLAQVSNTVRPKVTEHHIERHRADRRCPARLGIIKAMSWGLVFAIAGCASDSSPVADRETAGEATPSPLPTLPTSASAPSPKPTASATPKASDSPDTSDTSDAELRDLFTEAQSRATSAAALAQSAFTTDDWQLVVRQWQQAVGLLERIPDTHPRYGEAQEQLAEYRSQLEYAQGKVEQPAPERQIELNPNAIAAAKARQAAAQSADGFLAWCQAKSAAPESVQATVNTLLAKTETADCATAEAELAQQTSLDLSGAEIADLRPLRSFPQVTVLNLSSNSIADLAPLTDLPNLNTLILNDNQINDLTPLQDLTQLQGLNLNNNTVVDVRPLAALTQLESLELSGNDITDAQALATLTNLQRLVLSNNQISEIDALSALTQLQELLLANNPLADADCPVEPESVCQF